MAKRQRKQKTFSDQLRELIDSHDLSRNSICKLAEVDKGQLSRFMAGNACLSTATVDKLWAALNLKIETSDK